MGEINGSSISQNRAQKTKVHVVIFFLAWNMTASSVFEYTILLFLTLENGSLPFYVVMETILFTICTI